MLEIFKQLFMSLNLNKILYCNWKGQHALKQNLQGFGDIDLFVPIQQKNEFEAAIKKLGFKRVKSYQASHEFIEHYYGYDYGSTKFAHIHVYFKIVTGESFSKNYMLPLDNFISDNIDDSFAVHTVNDNARMTIFLLRYFLKVGSIYGLWQYYRDIQKYQSEWDIFELNHGFETIQSIGLSSKDFSQMKFVFAGGSLIEKFMLSRSIKIKLKEFKRRNTVTYYIYIINNIILRLSNRFFLRKKKLFPSGMVVAICGLDGSGKSTLALELKKHFSAHFSTCSAHLGSPSSNFFAVIFKSILLVNRLKKLLFKSKAQQVVTKNNSNSTIDAISSVILAYSRKLESNKIQKLKRQGYLIICDRYPSLNYGKMDSPKIIPNGSKNFIYRYCHTVENKLYRSLPPADVIYHLCVPVEVAIERNNNRHKIAKETEIELRERFKINLEVTFLSNDYHYIDATKPLLEVYKQVAQSIWASNSWQD